MPGDVSVPEAPPEGLLIRALREQRPHMSIRSAASAAGISESRWRQIESGVRWFRGVPYEERGTPAVTVARMAQAVGATPQQLAGAGRKDAAEELEALAQQVEQAPVFTAKQRGALASRVRRDARDGSDPK